MVIDLRVGYTKFGENRDPAGTFDPADLGFSSTALTLMEGYKILPLMTIGTFSTTNQSSTIASLGSQRADWGDGFNRPMTTLSVAPTVTRLWGDHSIRAGYDFRYQRWEIQNSGFPIGRYMFNGAYTRATNSAGLNDRAQSWAQFLLGLPTAGTGAVAVPGTVSSQFEIASDGDFRQTQHGLFIQDDWMVNPRLTVNLGARLEINQGMSESANRLIAGFDTTSNNPIEAQAQARYALNPIAQIPVSEFEVNGGLLFADGPINNTVTKILPRAAAAYLINERTVIRGGVGLFSYDYFFENINQQGYSQATPVQVTNDNGVTFTGANLTNPIPSGVLTQPVGNALGLSSQLGQPWARSISRTARRRTTRGGKRRIQRELPGRMLVAVTYIGSRRHESPGRAGGGTTSPSSSCRRRGRVTPPMKRSWRRT